MRVYMLHNVPATIIDLSPEAAPQEIDATLIFTPEDLYPLGIAIEEKNMMITVPPDQLIEKLRDDIKEGKL